MELKTGIVRDERYLDHKTGHIHPEHPNRLRAVYKMLDKDFTDGLITVKPELAPLEFLEFVHTPIYIEKVLKTAEYDFTSLAPEIPASAKTWLAACLAPGGCIAGLESLLNGACDVCFALVRPPGHHALPDRAAGFCIFNNIGITVRYAMKQRGFRRILIIDWDIHHGNGLQELFYSENEVLYFSSHGDNLYPYTGNWDETGQGDGEGYTINIPVPREMENREFLQLYQTILRPAVTAFRPELILICAGFDGHRMDPIGRFGLTEPVFGWLTDLILELKKTVANPPVLFSLEGGYHLKSLALCVREVLRTLVSKNRHTPLCGDITPRVANLVAKARGIHAQYGIWTD